MDSHTRRQCKGVLYKYTNVMKGWQYRYFELDPQSGTLHYFLCENNEKIISESGMPRGSVHLAAAVVCPSDEDSRTFTVNCASGDMLKLRASDARERQEWVNSLRAVAESHTKAIGASCPPLAPREHLAVLDALGCVRAQLQQTEQADAALCRALESCPKYHTDKEMLSLKATSAAALHSLAQCLAILQRAPQEQSNPSKTKMEDDF